MDAFLSRKFLVTIISGALIILNEKFGLSLDPEAVIAFGSIVIAYVTGQAVVDKNKVAAEVDAKLAQASLYIQQLTAALERVQKDPDA